MPPRRPTAPVQGRHEFKHNVNRADYLALRARLRAVLQPDAHALPDGEYLVRSLYFDTPDDRALRDKLDSLDRRDKWRLRHYGRTPEFIRLEKKSKVRGLCYKRAVRVTAEEVRRLQAGDTGWTSGDERDLVVELGHLMVTRHLRPKTIVEYTREPFTYPAGNVRVTLDRDLRTGYLARDLLADPATLATLPAGDGTVIVEVKYDQFIPGFIADLVRQPNRRATANSKYALSRAFG
ncbi:MAG: polyphosphate polymerase domain-containing protein [Propionibacteriaceae bacterium]|jgi:hypothetical protein|nr:polyphosphate polymerase domain-containing protein [Propionibacteriaceae bacterium]